MNAQYGQIYKDLLLNTDRIRNSPHPEDTETESCYLSCLEHWEKVKRIAAEDGFPSDSEEIRFFKYIKPKFTGQLEFYSQVYQYHIFRPERDPVERIHFHQRELNKINRFRELHHPFIHYMASGGMEQDASFFLRRNFEEDIKAYFRVFDRDDSVRTSFDWILTMLTGYGLYGDYVRGKMEGSP